MLFMFGKPGSYEMTKGKRAMGSGLLLLSLLSIGFGLAIIAAPELLAYIVAGFFLMIGFTLFSIWWNIRR